MEFSDLVPRVIAYHPLTDLRWECRPESDLVEEAEFGLRELPLGPITRDNNCFARLEDHSVAVCSNELDNSVGALRAADSGADTRRIYHRFTGRARRGSAAPNLLSKSPDN